MNRKNKNEKEKNTKPMGAAQELDMDALENVAGGRRHWDRVPGKPKKVYINTRDIQATVFK